MCNVSTQSYLSLYKSHFFVTGITMDKRIEENIRVKNQIAKAFLQLLTEYRVEDAETITISEITSKANVSRMAYYRNFKSKTDIINYYLSETLWKELYEKLTHNYNFWSVEYGTRFYTLMKAHRQTLLLLKNHGYDSLILSAFNKINEETLGDMPRNSINRFIIYYTAGASYNAMMQWLEDGCIESPEEMSRDFTEYCTLFRTPFE